VTADPAASATASGQPAAVNLKRIVISPLRARW
jgi:hypothetical protein